MANGSTLDQWNAMPGWLRALLGPLGPREAVPGLEQAKRDFPGPMPNVPVGPQLPPDVGALGVTEGPFPGRPGARAGMMPGLGEMPAPQRDSGPPFLRGAPLPGGMDDTRFRGPTGQMAPEVDLGGAVLPGAADTRLFREPPQAAPQGGESMDPQRRLELMKAARMFREGASEFANIPNAADFMLARHGVPMRDYRVRDEDLRADEERLRRGDFENPNSPASIGARQMIADATGQEVPEGMSAAAIMALNPMFDRLIRSRYAGQSQAFQQALGLSREARAQRGEERAEEKERRRQFEREEDYQRSRRPKPISEGTAEGLASVDATVRLIDEIIKEAPSFNTGPWVGRIEDALDFIGLGDWGVGPEKQAFKAKLNNLLATFVRSVEGGRPSDRDRDFLKTVTPSASDDDEALLRKAKSLKDSIETRRETWIGYLERARRETTGLQGAAGKGPVGGRNGQAGQGGVYVKRGGEVRGPVSPEEARRMLEDGEIDQIVGNGT